MDLGIKPKKHDLTAPAMPAGEDKVHYPEFDVRDEHAQEIREEQECKVGTEGEAKIKFRLSGDTKDKYSNRLTFEVLSMDITKYGDEEKEEDEDEDDKAEEKALGYKRKKPEPKETPDTSASSMY